LPYIDTYFVVATVSGDLGDRKLFPSLSGNSGENAVVCHDLYQNFKLQTTAGISGIENYFCCGAVIQAVLQSLPYIHIAIMEAGILISFTY